jgi:hypothetical protein
MRQETAALREFNPGYEPLGVIFDRNEVSDRSRHVGCAPKSGSKINEYLLRLARAPDL